MPNYIYYDSCTLELFSSQDPPCPQDLGPKGDTAPETSLPWAPGREGFEIFCIYTRSVRFLNLHFCSYHGLVLINVI